MASGTRSRLAPLRPGAPLGNTNAAKHGERSRRAYEAEENSLPPLVAMRVRNQLLVDRLGDMQADGRYCCPCTADWREQLLYEGMIWQHTKRIMALERAVLRAEIAKARLMFSEAKREYALASIEVKKTVKSERYNSAFLMVLNPTASQSWRGLQT